MRIIRCVIVCIILATTPFAVAQEKPNVVMILADDIGYGDIGIYGGKIPTPNIDRLARDGMRFTDAHSPAALCAPSRFSMLTGYSKDGAIREGDWVLTVDRHNKAEELYNLGNDLEQKNNLIDRPGYRDIIDRMHVKFLKHNDHSEKTRDPRTTEAFRVAK